MGLYNSLIPSGSYQSYSSNLQLGPTTSNASIGDSLQNTLDTNSIYATSIVPDPQNSPSFTTKLNNMFSFEDDGKVLGLDKGTWGTIGQGLGLAKTGYDIFNANRNYGLMKDYYNNQMSIQNEKMSMLRDDRAKWDKKVADTSASYYR